MTTLTHPVTGEQLPATITTTKAAEIIGIARSTASEWCRDGKLPVMERSSDFAPYRVLTRPLLRQLGLLDDGLNAPLTEIGRRIESGDVPKGMAADRFADSFGLVASGEGVRQ